MRRGVRWGSLATERGAFTGVLAPVPLLEHREPFGDGRVDWFRRFHSDGVRSLMASVLRSRIAAVAAVGIGDGLETEQVGVTLGDA